MDELDDTIRIWDCLKHRKTDEQSFLTRGITLRHQIRQLADVPMDFFPVGLVSLLQVRWRRWSRNRWLEHKKSLSWHAPHLRAYSVFIDQLRAVVVVHLGQRRTDDVALPRCLFLVQSTPLRSSSLHLDGSAIGDQEWK